MRTATRDVLAIALLTSLAVAQPLFALLGEQAEFFVAQGWGRPQVVLFALVLGLGLPVTLGLAPAVLNAVHKRLGAIVFGGLMVGLTTLLVLPFAKRAGLDAWPALVLSVVTGLAAGWAWRRYAPVRQFFVVLSPAVLLFPVVFLFGSRASSVDDGGPGTAEAPVRFERTPHVVMVVLDEFPLASIIGPDLGIDAEQFPNFARLSEAADWYPRATTGAAQTVAAVPEALTGRFMPSGTPPLPTASSHPRNLFTLLSGRYAIQASETATALCPEAVCVDRDASPRGSTMSGSVRDLAVVYAHVVVPKAWTRPLPSISEGWTGFGQSRPPVDEGLADALAKARLAGQTDWNRRAAEFEAFIETIGPAATPTLWYLHTLLPHAEWRYLPDGRQYLVEERWEGRERREYEGRTVNAWGSDEWAVTQARQRHLLQVQFVDRLVGDLVDRLQTEGMWNDTLLVVMGDHGVSFLPGEPLRAVSRRNRAGIAAVPLFIKRPGPARGGAREAAARLVDVTPTVADILGARPRWEYDGTSLAGEDGPARGTVRVLDAEGRIHEYPLDRHVDELVASAARRREDFGAGPFDLQAPPGPAALAGPISGVDAAADGRTVFDSPWLYERVDLESGFVPLRVTGRIEGRRVQLPATLAVAANGRIVTVTKTFETPDLESRFAAMLPPGALVEGRNTLSVFAVVDGDALARLPAATTGEVRLAGGTGSPVIEYGGESLPITDTGAGKAFTTTGEGGALVNIVGTTPAPRVVVFIDGDFAGEATKSGERFALPVAPAESDAGITSTLRVFALAPRRAWELAYPEPCSPEWHFAPPDSWRGIDCAPGAAVRWVERDGAAVARLDFSDPAVRLALDDHWSLDGSGVGWTTGPRARLTLPLAEGGDRLRFTARVKPFVAPPKLPAQNVWLLIDGEKAGEWRLDANEFTDIHWDAAGIPKSGGSLELTWLLPDAASPAAVGQGEDLRALGLAFQWLELRRGDRGKQRGDDG